MSRREVTGEAAGEIRHLVPDVETIARRLSAVDYLVDEGLATSMFLSLRLPQPLLLEGEAGVGKTEAGKALAAVLDTPLIRLQCYEGIDAAEALYEWNYPRQLLSIRLADSSGTKLREEDLFGPDYLIRRPLLRALEHPGPRPAVLLIDEIDRADDDFEAFLLELLAEATVTIPEIGPVRATHPPMIVLTSNRTRDLHDAVKRRCLYHWIDYPTPEREVEIVRRRVRGASETLAVQVADARRADARQRRAEAAGSRRGDRLAGRARAARGGAARRGRDRPHAGLGPQVRRGPGGDPGRRPGGAREQPRLSAAVSETEFTVETIGLDLPGVRRRVRPAPPRRRRPERSERSVRFARALTLVRPVSRRRLYWTARAVFVSDSCAADGVRRRVRGRVRSRASDRAAPMTTPDAPTVEPTAPDIRAGIRPLGRPRSARPAITVCAAAAAAAEGAADRTTGRSSIPVVPSDEELLRGKSFDALEPGSWRRSTG